MHENGNAESQKIYRKAAVPLEKRTFETPPSKSLSSELVRFSLPLV
jgi:hypothetical protein